MRTGSRTRASDSLEVLCVRHHAAALSRDENNLPLRAKREGEFFAVESQGVDAQVQGLDARR